MGSLCIHLCNQCKWCILYDEREKLGGYMEVMEEQLLFLSYFFTFQCFPSHDSSGFSRFCYLPFFFTLPPPQSLSHSSAIPAVCKKKKKKKKKCTADESKMHRSIQCSANTHSLLRQLSLCKNRTCARKVELCTVDTETKQHAGSDDVNVNQSHRSPWLTLVPPCCTQ